MTVKVKIVKSPRIAILVALTILAVAAPPAFGAVRVTAKVNASVSEGVANKVVFTAKTSRPGTVRVSVYQSSKVIRTMTAKRSGSNYTANWDLRTSTGGRVTVGSYSYRVAVRTPGGVTGSTAGAVTLPLAAPPVPTAVSGRWLGFYVPNAPTDMSGLTSVESSIGARAAVVHFFISDWESFPLPSVQAIASHGSTPLVTMDFVRTVPDRGVDSILAGDIDPYLRHWADAAKAYGGVVWLRPFPEMNGNWSAWCGVVGTNTAAKTVAAWKHVHDIFAAQGAKNVKFVWNVNATSVPDTSANAIEAYWPGDDYVDYVTVDGYNFGNHNAVTRWQTSSQIFGDAYNRVTALTNKPFFIAETACTSNGGDKPEWIGDFFKSIGPQFPRITGVCWFNADKEEDWRVEESADTLAAMKNVVQGAY